MKEVSAVALVPVATVLARLLNAEWNLTKPLQTNSEMIKSVEPALDRSSCFRIL